ncbi:hypothetical protein ABEB36_006746 [Hypothenemus hampei]
MDNRANQKNPNNWKTKGHDQKPSDWNNSSATKKSLTKAEQDFRSQQKNPNNDLFYKTPRKS